MEKATDNSSPEGTKTVATEGRDGARDSLLLAARLRFEGDEQTHDVRIRNLSAGGLMAEFDDNAEVGDRLSIEVRNIGWVKGRVAWATDGRLGVAFDREVDPMAARQPVGKGKKT